MWRYKVRVYGKHCLDLEVVHLCFTMVPSAVFKVMKDEGVIMKCHKCGSWYILNLDRFIKICNSRKIKVIVDAKSIVSHVASESSS